ncbi:hypothetical protein [Mycobacteroides abscessus]|uniref:hypothetical protein n=1 Tax=Mycobacteroides abscessus TaxID=36809 RepID=UPI0009A6BB98|nr:hypothetical protein [Mycobacteroides abscessus]SLG56201.1 Uncharacterised protein [Mycobacteroides abscessus subsp. abscessus]
MRRVCASGVAGAMVVVGVGSAPAARAYDSWCDLVETHGPRIAVLSNRLINSHEQWDIDRLNSFYDKVIPQLNTVGYAAFWNPNVWGSPDIRPDTRDLLGAMHNLQDSANQGQHTDDDVLDVQSTLVVIHTKCDGKRGLPPNGG